VSGTLRLRLTALATGVVAVVLGASAIAVVTIQAKVLNSSVEEALSQRADNLTPLPATLPSEGDREDSFLQLLDASGAVVASTDNVRGLPAVAPPSGSTRFDTVSLRQLSAHDYRVLTRPTGGRTLVVAKNVDDVQDSLRVLIASLGAAIPVAVLLLAGLLWWLVGRVLSPVEAIRAEVANIGATELDHRVPVPDRDDEISRLARTMNAMLERVQHATDRQRQFVADASHELRSPLTRIRSTVEVALAHPALEPTRATLEEVATDATALQDLVRDLLLLARSEQGPLAPEPVDLDDLVLAEADRLRQRDVHVDTSAVTAARTTGDPRQLARVVANLSDNAARHAASFVGFELREAGDVCELVVTDDGPGISEADRLRVFDRFTRLDDDRSREGGGAGLGLAIVHDIVVRHGGTAAVTATTVGARFLVRLPRAD
jgi:signal transduction histidine kinase